MTQPLTVDAIPTVLSAVVRPVGEVDWGTAPLMRAAFDRALREAADGGLLVDLSGITFMDCAGLNVLLRARHDWGDRLRLFQPPASLRRILRALNMEETFTIVDTLATVPADSWPPGPGRETCEALTPVSSIDRSRR